MNKIVEVTINFSINDVNLIGESEYLITWIDGQKRRVESLTNRFITQNMAEAMYNIHCILAFNPNTKSINIKVL